MKCLWECKHGKGNLCCIDCKDDCEDRCQEHCELCEEDKHEQVENNSKMR